MFFPISDDAKQAFVRAGSLATGAGEKFPDSRRLLASLLAVGTHRASLILSRLGCDLAQVATETDTLWGVGEPPGLAGGECLAAAFRESQTYGDQHVDTDHLLLSLWTKADDPAARFLEQHGISLVQVRQEKERLDRETRCG